MNISALKRFIFACFSCVLLLISADLTTAAKFTKINHFMNGGTVIAMETATKNAHRSISHMAPQIHLATQTIPLIQFGSNGDKSLWLNEALATLHYLPIQFSPADSRITSSFTAVLAAQIKTNNLIPFPGEWKWNIQYPSSFVRLWDPNVTTVITQGAIINFERQHNLTVDGIAGPIVLRELGVDLTNNSVNKSPYTYVTVSTSLPEHLDVWQGGHKAFSAPANTGISNSPTPTGTWPIYMRLLSQTMTGKSPSGSTYMDKGVPFVSYFHGGCAIHGFPRTSYGTPQSLGCVELPLDSAKQVYSLLDYGTLVTIQS